MAPPRQAALERAPRAHVHPWLRHGNDAAVHRHLLDVSGGDPEQAGFAYTLFGTYLFHLAQAIPFLDITGTVDWTPTLDFNRWYGDLSVLLYKLMVVVPLIQLLGLTLKQFFDESRAAGALAEEPASPAVAAK